MSTSASMNAETDYKHAVRAAERLYGQFHGEVGLALLRLAAFYWRHGRFADAEVVEAHIAEITAIYRADQAAS